MRELQELSARALTRPASQPAVEFAGRWISWGELRRTADQLEALINSAGVGPLSPIAFVPRNHPSAIAALLGLVAKGRTIRMFYAFQTAAALARDLQRIEPSVVIAAAQDYSKELLSVLEAQGSAGIALEEMDARAVSGLEQSRQKQSTDAASGAGAQIEILTSGTTGLPKRFPLSYELIARHFLGTSPTQYGPSRGGSSISSGPSGSGASSTEYAADLYQRPPALLFMPLGNISGLYSTLPALLSGQRAVLLERFTVRAWHEYVLRYRPEVTGLPPAGVQMVLDANIPPADLACIRRLGTGAAPLDVGVHRAFEERYRIPILLSYGATEFAGPVAAMTAELHSAWGQQKFGSVGRALPGAQLRIIDPDSGAVLPSGQEGLLEVISPRMGPEWIRTSDLAVIDADGFLFLRGRADGAIMRGGFKLLPETIERALLLHEAVSAAAVTGIRDERLGEVPAAAIQCKPGSVRPSASELEAHLRNHVYATHIPVKWRFVEDLPRTPSFKIDRSALRALFE